MVSVKCEKSKDGILRFAVTGHANSAPKGQDIICSAVSILVSTLAYTIMDEYNKMDYEPSIRINDGDSLIECKPKPEWDWYIRRYFQFAENGCKLLADRYPQYVGITA